MWCLGRSQRGDTLVEVLMAIVALSLVVTLSYGVMTRSFAEGQTALERTTTQGMLSGQIAMLRSIFAQHEQSAAAGLSDSIAWNSIKNNHIAETTNIELLTDARTACLVGVEASGKQAFYFNPASADPTLPQSFPTSLTVRQASSPTYGNGLWLEGYKVFNSSSSNYYYIFFAKTCWDAAISGERQSMVTTVRFDESYQ